MLVLSLVRLVHGWRRRVGFVYMMGMKIIHNTCYLVSWNILYRTAWRLIVQGRLVSHHTFLPSNTTINSNPASTSEALKAHQHPKHSDSCPRVPDRTRILLAAFQTSRGAQSLGCCTFEVQTGRADTARDLDWIFGSTAGCQIHTCRWSAR